MSTTTIPQPKKLRAAFKKEVVNIPDKDDRDVLYVVREFDGAARSKYMTWIETHSKPVEGGEPGERVITSMDGLTEVLLCPCLFKLVDGTPVPAEPNFVLHGLPDETVAELLEIARGLNGLGKQAAAAEKNGSESPRTESGTGSRPA